MPAQVRPQKLLSLDYFSTIHASHIKLLDASAKVVFEVGRRARFPSLVVLSQWRFEEQKFSMNGLECFH